MILLTKETSSLILKVNSIR